MQKLEMFSIFDSKAKAYLQPFFSLNRDTARRDFSAAINEGGRFNQFTEDYSLFYLGVFDQDEGIMIVAESAIHITNGITLKNREYETELVAPLFNTKETTSS